jgi:hypothetical protein
LTIGARVGFGARHPAATRSAFTADPRAFFHPLYLLAASGAGFANLGADSAKLAGEGGTAQHEVGRGLADLRTVHHEAKMVWRDMLAACLQAMVHRFLQAGLMAFSTGVYARLHLGVGSVRHSRLLPVS